MKRIFVLAGALLCVLPMMAQNIENQVVVSQFGQWSLKGNQSLASGANTIVNFNACLQSAGGKSFYALAANTPIYIHDPGNTAIDETITPTNIVNTGTSCSATLTPSNAHPLPYYITSGTAGLQEAINANALSGAQNTGILDSRFYAGGGSAAIIAGVGASANLGLLDVTQAPYVAYRAASGVYTANGNVGGLKPAAAAGAAAGTSPTISDTGNGNTFTLSLASGTATTTGTLFTATWPSTASFSYAPNCTVVSSGANAPPAFTFATSGSSTHVLTVSVTVAPPISTAYLFQVACQ